MGLFKSPEEKLASQKQKVIDTLEKFGLNIEDYSDSEIRTKNSQNIRRVTSDLVGNGMIKASMAFSFAKAEEQAKVSYLSALVEQNWILIRQNEAIIRKLDKLSK